MNLPALEEIPLPWEKSRLHQIKRLLGFIYSFFDALSF
jgi:hypothetical protein